MYGIFHNMPIEAYEGGIKYLGGTGSGYGVLEYPEYKIIWAGDDINIATVTDGAGFSDQGILPLPGESMLTTLPNKIEIVIYRR